MFSIWCEASINNTCRLLGSIFVKLGIVAKGSVREVDIKVRIAGLLP
jgi:hypothetical protein